MRWRTRHGLRFRALHFAVLGALLFALLDLRTPADDSPRPTIVAASNDAADGEILLREAFAAGIDQTDKVVRERLVGLGRDLHLAPAADPAGLEREARELGLHRSDPLIRRHLIDMMRLLAAGAPAPDTDDAALRAAYDAEPQRYASAPRVTFTHVFLSRARRGSELAADASALLVTLRAAPAESAAGQGDAFVRGPRVRRASADEIARVFGPTFAATVLTLPAAQWFEPLPSPFGLHLVRVEERLEAEAPPFDVVRSRMLHAQVRDSRAKRFSTALETLRRRYDVRIEPAARAGRG